MLQVIDLVLMQASRARYLGWAPHQVQCHQLSVEYTGLLYLLFVALLCEHVGFDAQKPVVAVGISDPISHQA